MHVLLSYDIDDCTLPSFFASQVYQDHCVPYVRKEQSKLGTNGLRVWLLISVIVRYLPFSQAKRTKFTLFLTYVRNKVNLVHLACEDGFLLV